MIVGVDASNLRSGGSVSHLTNIMAEGDPPAVGIRELIVWGGRKILDELPERPWLRPVHVPVLDVGFFKCQYWICCSHRAGVEGGSLHS